MFGTIRARLASLGARLIAMALGSSSRCAATVLIVTKNHGSYLDLTLAGLSRQSLDQNVWEVVVVDCESQDDTQEVIASYQSLGNLNISSIRQTNGASQVTARNRAVEASNSNILVFLGDDRIVRSDFLAQHLTAHASSTGRIISFANTACVHTHLFAPQDGVMDGVSPLPVVTRDQFDYNTIAGRVRFTESQTSMPRSDEESEPWLRLDIGNASIRREHVLSVGGFDESYLSPRVAGIDLAFRLHQHGVPYVKIPDGSGAAVRQFGAQSAAESAADLYEAKLWQLRYRPAIA